MNSTDLTTNELNDWQLGFSTQSMAADLGAMLQDSDKLRDRYLRGELGHVRHESEPTEQGFTAYLSREQANYRQMMQGEARAYIEDPARMEWLRRILADPELYRASLPGQVPDSVWMKLIGHHRQISQQIEGIDRSQ